MTPFKTCNRLAIPSASQRTAVLFLMATAWLAGTSQSDAEPRIASLADLDGLLARPATAGRWERQALRPALDLLAELYDVSIFLDRRINPDALVSGDFPFSSLGGLLETIGSQHGFDVTEIEGVIYLGPPATTRRLRTLDRLRREEARRVNARASSRLLAESSLGWPDLTSPRDLVERVCRDARLEVTNAVRIPHDLWAANQFPRIPRATQLTMLLAGFDLTFDCRSDGTLTLRSIRDDEQWEEVYRVPAPRTHLVDDLQQEVPTASLTREGNALRVTGLVEEHAVVESWLRHGGRPPAGDDPQSANSPEELRFHLRVVRRPLGEVFHQLEKSTDFRFEPDRETLRKAGIAIDQIVSIDVQDADIDTLLKTLQTETGLGFRRRGREIEIFVRP